MKLLTINRYFIIAAFIICMALKLQAQEQTKGYKETMEMKTEENGDVFVTSVIKFNAATWDFVKQRHGNDPSVLKNELKKRFPKNLLNNFDIKNDDMERTSTIKFTIFGLLKLNENGKWTAELDSKNPDITKLTDNQFLLVDEGSAQTSKIILPTSASDAKVEKDAFGKAILTYTAPVSGGGGNIIKYLGFLVAAGGIFLLFKNRGLNTVVIKNAANKNINYNQAKGIDDAVVINHAIKESQKMPGDTEINKGQ